MKTEVFDIDDKRCHFFYRDFLVVNLPKQRKQECIDALGMGELYEYPRGAKRALASLGGNTTDQNNPKLCTTFMLDDKFRLVIREAEYDLVLQRSGLKILLISDGSIRQKDPLKQWLTAGFKKKDIGEQGALRQWLVENLTARGYVQQVQEQPFYKNRDALISGGLTLGACAAAALFYGEYAKSQSYPDLAPVAIAVVVGLGALVTLLKKVFKAKSFTEPVYVKNKN